MKRKKRLLGAQIVLFIFAVFSLLDACVLHGIGMLVCERSPSLGKAAVGYKRRKGISSHGGKCLLLQD